MVSSVVYNVIATIIITFLVTWTFSVIRWVLEDKRNLDKYISFWVLRPLEIAISVAVSLTAVFVYSGFHLPGR
ncbi:hypothetical protein BsWGS_14935 [Bradybaena similaris]